MGDDMRKRVDVVKYQTRQTISIQRLAVAFFEIAGRCKSKITDVLGKLFAELVAGLVE